MSKEFTLTKEEFITRSMADEVFRVKNTFTINKGQRIAQITLLEHKSELFCINSDVVRDGGFGSTGSN